MGTDAFAGYQHAPGQPAEDAATITPHDTNELTRYTQALLVGADGAVKVTTVRGTDVVLPMVAGLVVPIRVKRVWDTGTDEGVKTAGIIGLY